LPAFALPPSAALFLVLVHNLTFWKHFVAATGGLAIASFPVQLGMALLLVLALNAFFSLLTIPYLLKPLLIVLILASSVASYFMDQYGTAIDWSMVQNVVETDVREGAELLNLKMLARVLLLGGVPALLVACAELRYAQAWRQALLNGGIGLASISLALVLLLLMFKTLAPALREHRELRFFLAPTNFIQAINGYVQRKWSTPVVVNALGSDAVKGGRWHTGQKRTVTVIVVGETARAENFSLNNYERTTNPLLARQPGLFNFTRMYACGTSTAVSLPCLFSALGRSHYSAKRAQGQEGLLDVFKHAGFDVLWRDNNAGCKGVCDRVRYEDLSQPRQGDPNCNDEECFDERLLAGLPELIRDAARDMVIVLHQKGSHGPAYWKRYPQRFKVFGPVCETKELAKCSRESIVAAYDNSILYTDYVLSRAIDILAQASLDDKVDTALVYFSDHGESLGKNNLYLHGAPYIIAPSEQRHVPFMLWLSDGFGTRFEIDRPCLAARSGQIFSHDNIFHSMVGMLGINTAIYNPKLDVFNACTRAN
jgi:lipid A ethanolaminephosphotransferase